MTYQFRARAIGAHDNGNFIDLMNGRAAQVGLHEPDWPFTSPVADQIAEGALLDAAYCIDAPAAIPMGGCYGVPSIDEFAAAMQITRNRG